jgi:hypothetical protein
LIPGKEREGKGREGKGREGKGRSSIEQDKYSSQAVLGRTSANPAEEF